MSPSRRALVFSLAVVAVSFALFSSSASLLTGGSKGWSGALPPPLGDSELPGGGPTQPESGPGSAASSVGVGTSPSGVAYDPVNGEVYVANSGSNNVSVISGTGAVVTVAVGSAPGGVGYDPGNGDVYVANSGSANVTALSGTAVIAAIRVTANPSGVAYDPGNAYVYVSDLAQGGGDSGVSVLSGTRTVANITGFTGWAGTSGVAIDGANGDAYEAVTVPAGWVSVFSGTTWLRTIHTGENTPDAVAYDPADGYVYVANEFSNNVTVISGTTIVAAVGVGNSPDCIGYDPTNQEIYVANWGSSSVTAISGTKVVASIPVGLRPVGVAYDSGNGDLYVANSGSDNVSIILAGASGPTLTGVSVNPSSDGVAFGGSATFTATPTCSGTCPAGTTYSWSATNTLGSLGSTTGASVTFTAGSTAGTDTLFVNATLNGVTQQSAPVPISISGTAVTLAGVSIFPSTSSLAAGSTQTFVATPACSTTCPSGIVYTWSSGGSSLGTLSPTSGATTTFTAGSSSGSLVLTVTAALGGSSQSAQVTITISSSGIPEITLIELLAVPLVLVVAFIAVGLAVRSSRRRKREAALLEPPAEGGLLVTGSAPSERPSEESAPSPPALISFGPAFEAPVPPAPVVKEVPDPARGSGRPPASVEAHPGQPSSPPAAERAGTPEAVADAPLRRWCSSCGAKLDVGAGFCAACGRKVPD